MATEQADRMTPKDWKRATDELITLTLKAQEHLEQSKSDRSSTVRRK